MERLTAELKRLFSLALACSVAASAQAQCEWLKLEGEGFNEHFGSGVAVDDDTAVIGAPGPQNGGPLYVGSARVYVRQGVDWELQAELNPPAGDDGDFFGFGVAIDGDVAAVGAYGDDDQGSRAGAVYVFERSGTDWSLQDKVVAADGNQGDHLGLRIALHGDTIVAGATGDSDTVNNGGSAYVFVRSGTEWEQQAKLVSNDVSTADFFGSSVTVYGDTAIVGAQFVDVGDVNSGAAYVFERTGTTWTQAAKLAASDSGFWEHFGTSASLFEDRVLIGADDDTQNGQGAGAAYVFERDGSTWSQVQKLTASDGAGSENFGSAVALRGDRALITAHTEDRGTLVNAGAAYSFEYDGSTWVERAKVTASDASDFDYFGRSVALDERAAVIGSWSGNNQSAYFFDAFLQRPTVYCTAKSNSLTCFPQIGFQGCPSVASSSGFEISAKFVRNQKFGVLLYGFDGPLGLPFQGGFLCVAPPMNRTPPVSAGGNPPPVQDCSGVLRVDMNAFAAGAIGGNPQPELQIPGTQVNCQWFARDAGDPFASSLTDGLEFTIGS